MERIFTYHLPKLGSPVELPAGETEDLLRGSRLRDGDVVEASDHRGRIARVTLRIAHNGIRLEALARDPASAEGGFSVGARCPFGVEVCLSDARAMERVAAPERLILEKAVGSSFPPVVQIRAARGEACAETAVACAPRLLATGAGTT